MRNCEEKEERVMLLESWRSFEEEFGSDATKERVDKLMPEKIKKRRKLQAEDGVRVKILHVVALNPWWLCAGVCYRNMSGCCNCMCVTAGAGKKLWPEMCC